MTSPLHGEDPGFKSLWAHLILVTEIAPNTTTEYMKIELDVTEADAYTNFVESIRGEETRRGYIRNLTRFLKMIPDDIFEQYIGEKPKSRDIKEMSQLFIDLARKDIAVTKSILKSYVKEVKQEVNSNKISPNTVSNRLKPIKALLSANEIDVSWNVINKMLPRQTKSEDRAYTREEIQKMIQCCTDVTDKVIILMFSSAGFRLESWDYFCWKDVIFFQDKTQQYTGAALRVYRGDPEEYWTFITPEACKVLQLYREEWRSRFLKYPDQDDPLIASTRFDIPTRLKSKGVRSRVDKIVTKIGLRDGAKKNQRRYEVKLDHGFRKYFNTMMRRAKVNYLDKEDMMGHKVGLESSYERYQEEDFERFPEYQKAIPFLTISDEERLRVESSQKQEDIEKLELKNQEIENLLKRVDDLECGQSARSSQLEKALIAAGDDKGKQLLITFVAMLFEGRASEEDKKIIWKKMHEKENLTSEELYEICGESKFSLENLNAGAKMINNVKKKIDSYGLD